MVQEGGGTADVRPETDVGEETGGRAYRVVWLWGSSTLRKL